MAKPQSVTIDPKELQRSQEMWGNFTFLMKWSVIACVAVLALLGLAFVSW